MPRSKTFNARLRRQLGPLFLIIASCLTIYSGIRTYSQLHRTAEASTTVERTYQILGHLDAMLMGITAIESGSRGFVLTGNAAFLGTNNAAAAQVWIDYGHARELIRDPQAQEHLAELRSALEKKIAFSQETILARGTGSLAQAQNLVASGEGLRLMNDVASIEERIKARQEELLTARQAALQERQFELADSSLTTTGLSLAMFLLSALVGVLMLRRREDELSDESKRSEDLVRQRDALGARVSIDGLTGLVNQSAFLETVTKEVEHATRHHIPLSALLLDVDSFKAYNDSFGHLEGNEVLIHLASIFKKEARVSDTVARFGGEEFAVLLRDADSSQAQILGERIRSSVEKSVWPTRAITISGGIATLGLKNMDAESLLESADRALYVSKGQGRNCVSVD